MLRQNNNCQSFSLPLGLKKAFFIVFVFCQCSRLCGQDPPVEPFISKHGLFLHYYPSALVGGDLSVGLEYQSKKNLSLEFAFNHKLFTPGIYHYNKGYRLNYLLKYDLSRTESFRFSIDLSAMYMNIYFKDKTVDYYYYELSSQNSASYPYLTLKEDRRLEEYGAGIGLSMHLRIYKNLFAGSDLIFNAVKTRTIYNITDLIAGNLRNNPYGAISTPCEFEIESQGLKLMPYMTLKLSYLIHQ